MNTKFSPILVDKAGVSDDFYVIVATYTENGQAVSKGELLLCFETSKAAYDVEAPQAGFYFGNVKEGDHVVVGDTLAVIAEDTAFDLSWFDQFKSKNTHKPPVDAGVRVSKSAQQLIDQNNLTLEVFGERMIVSKTDVEEYLKSTQPAIDLKDLDIDDNSIVIYGAGGHSSMCLDLLYLTQEYNIVGAVDSTKLRGDMVLNTAVLGPESLLQELFALGLKRAVLGIGNVLDHQVRGQLYKKLIDIGYQVPNICHPSASVECSVTLGSGNQIMQGAIIGSNVKIGDNCIINSGSIISHDCDIGDDVHIAPGAILAGSVTVERGSVVGMGATVFMGVKLGEAVTINNGINVFSDVPDGTIIKSQEN